MCPNDFVLHNFGNVPAPSSWLTVTASPTNCSLINYAALRTIKQFEFPISLYLLELLNVVLVHKIIIAVRFAVVCQKITKISNTFISTHVCGIVLTANGPSDAGVVDVCVIVANTFINLRRIRIVTTWINRLANEVLYSLSLPLSYKFFIWLPSPSQLCQAIALCSPLSSSNRSRSIPIAIVQLQREPFACQTSESASLRLGSGLPP